MAEQVWLIFTPEQREVVLDINDTSESKVIPRLIDNPIADNLGEGALVGNYIAPARLLNDPDCTAFYEFCGELPIRTMDSDALFLPDPDEQWDLLR